jgi:hypothetical protein
LIAKNSNEIVKSTTSAAFTLYSNNTGDIIPVLKKIAELKGVGPATASLILAVHDPENVVFFSDEAFLWLVHDGDKSKKSQMKYDLKEYQALYDKARVLMAKLSVTPIDIEKVAYVIGKDSAPEIVSKGPKIPSGLPRGRPKIPENQKKAKKPAVPDRGRGRPSGSTTASKQVSGDFISPATSKSGRSIKAPPSMYNEAKIATPRKRKATGPPSTGNATNPSNGEPPAKKEKPKSAGEKEEIS